MTILFPRSLLPLVPSGLTVDRLLPAPEHIILITRSNRDRAACPLCHQPRARVDSSYSRRLADLPWQGRILYLHLRVRRFRCTNRDCRRRIFAERLALAQPKARRTLRRREIQQQIGLALGGEPGSRLAGRLAMPVSGDTLRRLIRARGGEIASPPRIIAGDDWAWRRGHRYGTIICDLERHRVIDRLPDRTGETLASWLRQHGEGVAVVSRDRAGAYAEGIRAGAPPAVQIADRWHLMVNASDARRQMLDRHRAHVERRWAEGCRNSAQLWRELRDRGFAGGYGIVRRWAIRRRGRDAAAGDRECPLPSWRVPSSRRAARLLTTPDATLTRADRQVVDTLTALSSEIRTAAEAVNEFDRILRERDAAAFDLWLATTQATALRGFATGIINDIAAVRVALSQPGSNGPVEGQVNRLKMLKRQMYGRAKFDLLRSRVLHAA